MTHSLVLYHENAIYAVSAQLQKAESKKG